MGRYADISKYQGNPNWPAFAKTPDLVGIISRIADGITRGVDPDFVSDITGARAVGLKTGGYFYVRPLEDPIAQAELLVKTVKNFLPMPIALDLEPTQNSIHLIEDWGQIDNDTRCEFILKFLARLEILLSGSPMIYSTKFFMETFLKGLDLSAYPLWVADYNGQHLTPTLPPFWKDFVLWQKSPVIWVEGISSEVDLDIMNCSALPEVNSK